MKESGEVCYRRQMGQNEMMICVDSKREGYYETRMLKHNEIPGLLKFSLRRMDDKCWFCYQITSRQPLVRLVETQPLKAEPLRRLLYGMIQTFLGLSEYLLSEEQILLEPEFLYIDLDDWTPKFCLMPGKEGDFSREFSQLLQFLLEKTDHRDKEAVALIYGLYRESLKENYGFEGLLERLAEPGRGDGEKEKEYRNRKVESEVADVEAAPILELPEKEEQVSKQNLNPVVSFLSIPILALLLLWIWKGPQGLWEYGMFLGIGSTVLAVVLTVFYLWRQGIAGVVMKWNKDKKRPEKSEEKEAVPSWAMIFEAEEAAEEGSQKEQEEVLEVSLEEDGTHTTLLWSQPEKDGCRCLVSADGKNEDIEIRYYPFLIGKQENLSDYVLNRGTVSRLHIRLDREAEVCSLTDLNSTNGTSVNGRRLEANETVTLSSGDEILIADQRFRFQ